MLGKQVEPSIVYKEEEQKSFAYLTILTISVGPLALEAIHYLLSMISIITTEYETHYQSSYNCLDVNPESIGSSASEDGALFHYTVSTCTGLACPPYENDRALSCVVCTK